ncbi:hypothetical protein [Oenococcus oeni]|uniref:Uncharacterized protein n=1 Tax=Oenococcus oeni (strain ATCC BAA-331 / PSU-1) TaxID=203123 RepID=Q04E94_OENOB|nr:hypothetical protein [Oenococcus oeni]ABJ57228.1 hypothetical protein OEOE_1362 [Oenococcus oeni PSU-1]OIK67720.1 hypothetical protein ATW66_06535 [Oenococcus oeni]OIL13973.1 hypothetical protein ATW95_06900 [Oenococcus oeni]OIL27686.1 hypothetical protein ATX04_07080 [Oenococcus oeni]OIL81080.1 hypothetical protein ATX37_06670 [Oenococcus oeni]
MKPVKPQQFALGLQDFLKKIDQINTKVSPSYSELKKFLDSDQLPDLSDSKFKNIAAEFMDTNEQYQQAVDNLKGLPAPVHLIGLKMNLVAYFQDYVNATKDMTNSLNLDKKSVDLAKFSQSEKDQDDLMHKVNRNVNRILMSRGLQG